MKTTKSRTIFFATLISNPDNEKDYFKIVAKENDAIVGELNILADT